ncbi:hypothetical protein SAY87_027923 [Trapa incisa]|uniref:Nuclear transcription factor Y subunit n=1 Tax=Trapa incisa TaxID=236973 RepID=A0AAN7KWX4_9MYRT|nr:hypothetical protein SAY87_027923 [Trapa incisa]
MEAVYFKVPEGTLHSPIVQLSSSPHALWTAGYGPQIFQQNLSSVGQKRSVENFAALKQSGQATQQNSNKGSLTQFIISSGDSKNSGDALKSQAALPEYCSQIELGHSQSMMCAKYPCVGPCYGVFSAHGPQLSGRIMLPMDLGANDIPIFVNPKQYHAILKSRQRRAKADLKNKLARARKPYMHESRHLHAMRRPRGLGGRFLNTKSLPRGKGETNLEKDSKEHQLFQPTDSQNSEVLQSDSGTLSSPRETNGSILSLPRSNEVTSSTYYAQEGLGRFQMNLLHPPLHSLPVSGMIDTGHGIGIPSTWVTAAENCRHLKV